MVRRRGGRGAPVQTESSSLKTTAVVALLVTALVVGAGVTRLAPTSATAIGKQLPPQEASALSQSKRGATAGSSGELAQGGLQEERPSEAGAADAPTEAPGAVGEALAAPATAPPAPAKVRPEEAAAAPAPTSAEAVGAAGQPDGVRKPKDLITAAGGNVEKTLVVFVHFHACSGKRMCQFAREAAKDPKSGVKLDGMQMVTAACNQVDPDPPENWLKQRIKTCEDLRRFCTQHGGSTWQFIETALDVRPPCPGIAFFTVIRQPWGRIESTQGKLGWLFPNASNVIKTMQVGESPVETMVWKYCPWRHSPTCNPFFRAGYFDNFYIRFLLGSREGAEIPWGVLGQEHLEKAKKILEDFDLVIPIDFIPDALPALQCAVGPKYDLGLDGTPAGRYDWPTNRKLTNHKAGDCGYPPPQTHHDVERVELCRLFREQNKWDRELYAWSVKRWLDWNAGRCRGEGTRVGEG